MAIRILALCAVLLLPLSVCQAVLTDGGFEAGSGAWQWAVNDFGSAGVNEEWTLRKASGGWGDDTLRPHEGSGFGALEPDSGTNTQIPRPQVCSVFQTNITSYDGWWFEGVYAFNKLHDGDYLRLAVVSQDVWDSKVPIVGGNYDYGASSIADGDCLWHSTVSWDTCINDPEDGTDEYAASWWVPWNTPQFSKGQYTVVFDCYRNSYETGYSLAGLDTISHTPEPSLGLLLLVGMIPVAIGFRRRRRS